MDLDRALQSFSETPIAPGFVPRVPLHELTRTPAAARVSALAAESGLFLWHHEHRVVLEQPEAWMPDDGEPAPTPIWEGGVLPESKYQAFRHDLPIGSFHPGHRAKWSTHELCHGLVGFGWRPDASPLFHATAGRLAEVVPVVLWYFLDEIRLRRCPRHVGPLFRAHCPACERAAASGPTAFDEERARELLRDAARFVDEELAAVARTRRLGVPCPYVWGSIDLCSDGVAYAGAHGPRLASEEMHLFAEVFLQEEGDGWFTTLEGLEARVEAVFGAIATGGTLPAWRGGATRWRAWDLAQRLLQVRTDTDGDVADGLLAMVEDLALDGDVARAHASYTALCAEGAPVAAPEAVFAVGYDLPGVPSRSVVQVREGLGTVVPLVLELDEDAGTSLVERFVAADPWVREPLGDRFAAWIAREHPGPVADLARFEATLRTAGGEAEVSVLGEAGEGARWVEGVRRLRFDQDIPSFAEAVERGEVSAVASGGAPVVAEPPGPAVALAIGRDRSGELLIADLPADLPAGWEEDPTLLGDLLATVREVGLVAPQRWW